MFLSKVANWFAGSADEPSARRRPNVRLEVESLEERALMSWSSVPATFAWPTSANVGFNSNARSGTALISYNEVDTYDFVAPRSGTYTFTAGKNGSMVDTVAGLFQRNGLQWNGTRLAGNDDSNGSTDSRFTAYLTANTRYAFSITNYTGTSTGGYKWSITGPPLYVGLNHNAGDGITTFAYASLTGNSLRISLAGTNNSNWYFYTHRVNVYLLDANNNAIHSGSWSLSVATAGHYVSGAPLVNNDSRTFDLSGWDLHNLRNIRIVVQ